MDANDKYACAELIQAWGLYRDQGKWPQLLATFVPEGQIAVSWFSGSFGEFVDRCRRSFEAGQRSKHQIFPSVVRLAGERALAETNIVILVRQKIAGVLADMTSYARFLDRLERRGGRWGATGGALGHWGARRHLRARRARPGRAVGSFRQVVRGERPLALSGGLPLHGRPPRRRRTRARAGRPLRRLPAHGAIVRALRGVARRGVASGGPADG